MGECRIAEWQHQMQRSIATLGSSGCWVGLRQLPCQVSCYLIQRLDYSIVACVHCRELSRPFKSIGNLCGSSRCSITAAFTAKGIIQLPIFSCSRRNHSICQASSYSILKISGCRQCGLWAAKGVVGLHSVDEVCYLRFPCCVMCNFQCIRDSFYFR